MTTWNNVTPATTTYSTYFPSEGNTVYVLVDYMASDYVIESSWSVISPASTTWMAA